MPLLGVILETEIMFGFLLNLEALYKSSSETPLGMIFSFLLYVNIDL